MSEFGCTGNTQASRTLAPARTPTWDTQGGDSGVSKRTGLAAALEEMSLSPHNAVAIGDAENDHALLTLCECAVSVANALPALKVHSDCVTPDDHGAGVVQLVDRLLADDLRSLGPTLRRHFVPIGHRRDGGERVDLPPYGVSAIVSGPSGTCARRT